MQPDSRYLYFSSGGLYDDRASWKGQCEAGFSLRRGLQPPLGIGPWRRGCYPKKIRYIRRPGKNVSAPAIIRPPKYKPRMARPCPTKSRRRMVQIALNTPHKVSGTKMWIQLQCPGCRLRTNIAATDVM